MCASEIYQCEKQYKIGKYKHENPHTFSTERGCVNYHFSFMLGSSGLACVNRQAILGFLVFYLLLFS
jgi:hypothetical protein